ncbi:MAG: FlgD immunoglobulin-like domain containing protein [Candidatus Marinimicrobia bacterium]|nr:FlgD immunoglobulin-like domain containing protein [Candidatus Neomarinimicrobiota bacterium]
MNNYPNPFNPLTHIGFGLPETSEVQVLIYDLNGRLIRTLVNTTMEAGYKRILWDGKNNARQTVSAGMYISVMRAGDFTDSRKMIMLK